MYFERQLEYYFFFFDRKLEEWFYFYQLEAILYYKISLPELSLSALLEGCFQGNRETNTFILQIILFIYNSHSQYKFFNFFFFSITQIKKIY